MCSNRKLPKCFKVSNVENVEHRPIMLTAKIAVAQILLNRAHRDNLHKGTQYLQSFLNKSSGLLGSKLYEEKPSPDVSNADTGTPTQSTRRWWTYTENDLMNMFSHSPKRASNNSEPSERIFLTYFEEMVLPLSLSNNNSSTLWNCTVVGHRVMSSCSFKSQCKTWLPKYHHQWQRRKFHWSSQGTEGNSGRMRQS